MGSNGANLIAYAALTALLMLVAGGSQAAPMECHFDSRGERNHDPKPGGLNTWLCDTYVVYRVVYCMI